MGPSLYEAVCSDNIEEARKLLQSGADTNSRSGDHACIILYYDNFKSMEC